MLSTDPHDAPVFVQRVCLLAAAWYSATSPRAIYALKAESRLVFGIKQHRFLVCNFLQRLCQRYSLQQYRVWAFLKQMYVRASSRKHCHLLLTILYIHIYIVYIHLQKQKPIIEPKNVLDYYCTACLVFCT